MSTSTSDSGVYEVQVFDRDDRSERGVRVQARSPNDAIAKVAALDQIVGSARLVEVREPADGRADDLKLKADSTTAAILSFLGLFFGPLAVVGMIWGYRLRARSNNR